MKLTAITAALIIMCSSASASVASDVAIFKRIGNGNSVTQWELVDARVQCQSMGRNDFSAIDRSDIYANYSEWFKRYDVDGSRTIDLDEIKGKEWSFVKQAGSYGTYPASSC